MADARQACESEYLTADVVRNLKVKEGVIIDGGDYEETEFGRRLTCRVEIETGEKKWRPNKSSAQNVADAFGFDTNKWAGRKISLKTIKVQGKDSVMAIPLETKEEQIS